MTSPLPGYRWQKGVGKASELLRDPKGRMGRDAGIARLGAVASASSSRLQPMTLSEFLTLVLLLFPGILLSLILMATFAAGG
ncbi:hypothetical protein ACVW0Q_000601 [Thermostichus sp. MS-CIW-21]|jgi:hypothetical protein|nr:hypothetical protein CYA_1469 [Synechococcus sp. JA-3-3Ab]